MLRESGDAGVRAMPARAGRPSRSGHSRVPSLTNFQPVGLVASTTGLNVRNARSRPSKPGKPKPAVSMKLLRCGIAWPLVAPLVDTIAESGSVDPVALDAPSRLTVPTIGLRNV